MPRRRRQGTIRNLILIASGLISGAVVAIGLTVWGFRTDAMDDAVNDANNIATLLAEQTARSVQSIDFALTELRDRFTPLPFEGVQELDRRLGGRDSHELLKERAARLPYAAVMTVIGRDGRLVSSSRNWPVESIDASDRDFFRFLKATPESGIYVSAPVASRGTGAQTIFFAKRLAGADGFAGVVVVGVELTYPDLRSWGTVFAISRDGG